MSRSTEKDPVQPRETRAEARSRVTDATSRIIRDDEVADRERKTERLRNARLAREAKAPKT